MYLLVLPAFSWKVVVLEGQCCLTNMSSICCWLSIGSVSSFTCDPIFPSKLNWHPYMIVSGQHDKMKAEAAVSLKTWLWKSHNTTPATICWPKQVIRWVQILGKRNLLMGGRVKSHCIGSWEEFVVIFCILSQQRMDMTKAQATLTLVQGAKPFTTSAEC